MIKAEIKPITAGVTKSSTQNGFDGSQSLYDACWREFERNMAMGAYDSMDQQRANQELDSIASEKVNNPKSKFYIYG